jgi:heme exporter protein B
MTPPGLLRTAWLVARKDLRLEGRTLEGLSAMGLFALIVLVVFNFGFDVGTIRELGVGRIVPGVLWITLAFSGIVGFARSFKIERQREALTALLLAPADASAIFLGKALANFLLLAILTLALVVLSIVFFDLALGPVAGSFALVLLVHTIGLAEVGTLFAAVAAKVGRGEALQATLLFPAATPLLLSAVKCTRAALDGEPLSTVSHWMLLAGGFDVLYLVVALAAFEHVLED